MTPPRSSTRPLPSPFLLRLDLTREVPSGLLQVLEQIALLAGAREVLDGVAEAEAELPRLDHLDRFVGVVLAAVVSGMVHLLRRAPLGSSLHSSPSSPAASPFPSISSRSATSLARAIARATPGLKVSVVVTVNSRGPAPVPRAVGSPPSTPLRFSSRRRSSSTSAFTASLRFSNVVGTTSTKRLQSLPSSLTYSTSSLFPRPAS